jgi:hypothetical protein
MLFEKTLSICRFYFCWLASLSVRVTRFPRIKVRHLNFPEPRSHKISYKQYSKSVNHLGLFLSNFYSRMNQIVLRITEVALLCFMQDVKKKRHVWSLLIVKRGIDGFLYIKISASLRFWHAAFRDVRGVWSSPRCPRKRQTFSNENPMTCWFERLPLAVNFESDDDHDQSKSQSLISNFFKSTKWKPDTKRTTHAWILARWKQVEISVSEIPPQNHGARTSQKRTPRLTINNDQ